MSPRIIARSHLFLMTSASAAACLLLAACGGSGGEGDHGNVAVTGVSLDRATAQLRVGTTLQLALTVSPSNATNPSVVWSTSSSPVATVSTTGLVTAVAKGVATITVTTSDGGKTATCEVTVSDGSSGNVAVTGVSLDRAAAELSAGAALQLTKTVSPSNATNPSVGWSTSSSSVATVSTTGLVTAVAKGRATITVTTSDGGKTATCEVTVTGTLTLVAGIVGSTTGSLNGTGSAARFNGPEGVAVDGSGNIYVGDTNSYTIRKVTPAGQVTTIAGLVNARGSADGTGMEARFYEPRGMAVDANGNVYVADLYNEAIRKMTPDGKVTTLAGGPTHPIFANPSGVAVDGAGNVYVADKGNHAIRKVTPDGAVSTLAGLIQNPGIADGTGTDARFYYPQSVAVDGSGNVYVGDSSNYTIRKVTPAGVVTTLAGLATQSGFVDGTGSDARFSTPAGVAVDDSGNVYVADLNNLRIRKVTPGGQVTTVASGSLLLWPSAIAISPVSGHLFIAENNAVLELAL